MLYIFWLEILPNTLWVNGAIRTTGHLRGRQECVLRFRLWLDVTGRITVSVSTVGVLYLLSSGNSHL